MTNCVLSKFETYRAGQVGFDVSASSYRVEILNAPASCPDKILTSRKARLEIQEGASPTLAKEIGENQGYQNYLITIRKVEAEQAVGIAQSAALAKAEIKVIANTGDVQSGISSVSQLLTSKGGTQLGAMLQGLANTDMGSKLLDLVGEGAADDGK